MRVLSGKKPALLATALLSGLIAAGGCVADDHYGAYNRAHGKDFGLMVDHLLAAKSEKLFGVERPVPASAVGPYTDADSANAVLVAKGLKVRVVSNATDKQGDMIALWPNDVHPTHLFVCVEKFFQDNNPEQASVMRVDLNGDPDHNVEIIVKGISSCDPVRRTAWGTLVIGEEAGDHGGFYEIFDPMSIPAANPIVVTDRATGANTDPAHLVKHKAVGNLSWEGNVVLSDGTMYFGDENRPSKGYPGGGIYKFVPDRPYLGGAAITRPEDSPFASGTNYGLRLGTRSGNTDYGQGSETGKGVWVAIDAQTYADADGNINLRQAQRDMHLTGYYRPEDMDRDPIAQASGIVRVCWANTGRMTNGLNSAIENGYNYGEVACMVDTTDAGVPTGASPIVERLVVGDRDANHFDNVGFQPVTGNLAVLEDGEVEVLNADGSLNSLRGNDVWLCLPDGKDRNVQSDGCIRIMSLKDTDSEPTGWIFDGTGRKAYVNLQHRATGKGALLEISGFKLPRRHHD